MSFLLEAVPANGNIIHAVLSETLEGPQRMYPDHPTWYMRQLVYSRSLCGVRGRDAWGFGGMRLQSVSMSDATPIQFEATDPNPISKTDYNGRAINAYCPRCISKAATYRKASDD
jgi:hypothetical protein